MTTNARPSGDGCADALEAQRFRELFDATPAAIVELDCTELHAMLDELRKDGVVDIRSYIDAHPAFVLAALERTRVVATNEHFLTLMRAPTFADACIPLIGYWSPSPHVYRQFIEARFDGKPTHEAETRMLRVDGTTIDCLVSSAYGAVASRPYSTISVLVDVGARLVAERELARVQAELAHAARVTVLGQLTTSIAHEVSQPLSTIALTSEAMLRWLELDEPDLDELRALARSTAEQTARAADVVGRIRRMARRAEPLMRPIALNALVQDGCRFLHHEFLRRDVQVETRLDPTSPMVLGDAVQLQQVFINLALNAIQAMTSALSAVRRLRVTTRLTAGGWVELWMEDTGPGVPTCDEARLFQRFHTTKPDGMGMGLPISQTIVQAHGGMLRLAERQEGWGCRFVMEVPAHTRGTPA
ncbi:ATP-binding protein [Luteibacter sp. 329MFSha]|uniref:sensor histidine kinase n=1 Tax=Luteibacter sp. 329MFSha TaxID=1798239 RepID=UPI0008C62018|nr:ATP-binding protein [Luteibacter sp. 329MFSha]SEW24495.1 His Kinase A (phospho-acceptor) domain-containing protein [Luteibacter sp. 329MFSha]